MGIKKIGHDRNKKEKMRQLGKADPTKIQD